MILVKDQIIQFTENLDLRHVYGVSGANIEDVFSGFKTSLKTKPVLAKTEYQAALMAMGSYLVEQKAHLVLTTSGAGVLNTLPVLAEAFSSRIPFVLIAGLVPMPLQGQGGFQDTSNKNGTLNLEAMIKPSVGFLQQVRTSADVLSCLHQAFASAQTTKLPSVVLIPKNIFSEAAQDKSPADLALTPVRPVPPLEAINKVLKNITKQPLLILGEELIHLKNRENINLFAEKLDAKVAVTPGAKGFFNHQDSRFLGLTGMMGHSSVSEFIDNTEVVIVLGSRMDVLSRVGIEAKLKAKTIIHLSYFSESNYLPVQLSANGDMDLILKELLNDF